VTARAFALSSPDGKNISVFPKPNQLYGFRHPVPEEGRWPSSRTLGWDAVDAGGAKDESADFADGQIVWS
jgi:hypothetical protein